MYQTDSSCLVGSKCIVGLVEGRLDVLGVFHGFALLLQFLLFVNCELGILQLFVLELQKVQILTVALDVVLQFLQLAFSR